MWRGGSCKESQKHVRCACRIYDFFAPCVRFTSGFRVVVNGARREPVCWVMNSDSLGYHRQLIRSAYRGLLTPHIRVVASRVERKTRALRGGSFGDGRMYARCTFCYDLDLVPYSRDGVGFRVVVNGMRKDVRRVLRGGSFNDFRKLARCVSHYDLGPNNRFGYDGFRVVVNGVRGEIQCVLRGGSFYFNQRGVRSACHYRIDSRFRDVGRGFRVVMNGVKRESIHRVLHGGAWDCGNGWTRPAFYGRGAPGSHGNIVGFRVVANMLRRKVRGGSHAFDRRLARCAFPGWVDPVSLLRDRGLRVVVNRVRVKK